MAQTITHRGTVKSVDGKHISVEIAQASACSACVAKKLCNSSESKDKLVDVVSLGGMTVKAGVKKAEALDGLQKGVYIVDGKKYVVK